MDIEQNIIQQYQQVRHKTEELCQPLNIEDYVIQSVDDVSPAKWHLAHTTWFFETFVLKTHYHSYKPFNPIFHHLFNSYYQSIGDPFPRVKRGVLSRPTVETIYQYRKQIDEKILELISQLADDELKILQPTLILGLQHEQQHQELLLMDIKKNFSYDPSYPVYQEKKLNTISSSLNELKFNKVDGGIVEIGHEDEAFCYDNELPFHQVILNPYSIANRLITNGEYQEFIQAGGYQEAKWWLADGWDCVQKNNWQAPLYWQKDSNNEWHIFTLNGIKPLNLSEPVLHISYYEADAFACWKNCRLPTEAEWENYVNLNPASAKHGNLLEENNFHSMSLNHPQNEQFFGDAWEWTASAYLSYPGFKPLNGALGEYNGKFMNNQFVLRGGSCVTPRSHIRKTYRNFFQPDKRWQFSGIRLAKDS